jgi:gas vesicle protein
MSKKLNAVIGFMSGIATGAILGVMYAPDKSSKTREKF